MTGSFQLTQFIHVQSREEKYYFFIRLLPTLVMHRGHAYTKTSKPQITGAQIETSLTPRLSNLINCRNLCSMTPKIKDQRTKTDLFLLLHLRSHSHIGSLVARLVHSPLPFDCRRARRIGQKHLSRDQRLIIIKDQRSNQCISHLFIYSALFIAAVSSHLTS